MIKDKPIRIGTEEILEAVFKDRNKYTFMKRLLSNHKNDTYNSNNILLKSKYSFAKLKTEQLKNKLLRARIE